MRPAAPNPPLRASVVVPARNEEDLIGDCLRALATQVGVSPGQYEVLLVLDRCTDGTEARALEVAADFPELRLYLLDGPGEGSGAARRAGMEAACERLLQTRGPEGLLASTDADTVVAPDWLASQLRAVEEGARAIGGRIDLADDDTLPPEARRWHTEHSRLRHRKLLSDEGCTGAAEHWQFSGASLSLTAGTYRAVGGLEARVHLEDEHLEAVLTREGVPIERLLSVRATTSARLTGRAGRGLAYDLSRAANGSRSLSTHEQPESPGR